MRNFQDTFETRKRSFISTFSICMTVPLKKVSAKLLSDLVIFSMFSCDIPLDFHQSIRVVPLNISCIF